MEANNGSGRADRKVKPVQIRRGSVTVRIYDQSRSSNGTRYTESLVCWYDSERRRLRRSFAEPKEARLFAEGIASQLSRGEVAGTTLNGVEVSTFKELTRIADEFGMGPLAAMSEWRNARSILPAGTSLEMAVKAFLNHRLVRGPAAKGKVAWVKNGLRHSFCSYRLAQTGDAAKTALEAGNSSAMIFRHYRELVPPDRRQPGLGFFRRRAVGGG